MPERRSDNARSGGDGSSGSGGGSTARSAARSNGSNAGGLFITFEGGEGCGKSSHMAWLTDVLEDAGRSVLAVREPGSLPINEAIRVILLNPKNTEMSPLTELLLYEAARAQLVTESIRPALAAGRVVLCDRFYDSTTAYQGYGRGLDTGHIASLNLVATGGLKPDRTLVLDVPIEIGLPRATKELEPDRLEQEDRAFHERVHEGFLAIAAAEPERVRLIDTSGEKLATRHSIARQLLDLLPELKSWAEAADVC
ncbi:MAG: dTMP kinase [Coriobacteriia bacterium]|nr:dTMP kinase [Coriobacteriia bacterium]